jgi:hypothetical protein
MLIVQSRGTLQEGVPSAPEVQVESVIAVMNFSCVKCEFMYGLCTAVRSLYGLRTEWTVSERTMTLSNFMYGLSTGPVRANTVFRFSQQRKPPTPICRRENT